MSQANDPRIGTELAGFRIDALIGRGGMGVVYLAEQLRYGRRVAIKVLAPELAADESFRERFEQEWRMAAKLDHPNIVPIFEAGEAEGVLYIAMRYVEGIDLNALLAAEGRLEPERALRIVGQVGHALDAAHAHGLVHRDVKPGNILLAGVGAESEHVYLTDFGVAKHTKTRSGLTRTGFFVGTVDYAAPEQIEGRELDGRADVYSLGCVLFQCLAGELPFEKDSEVAMLYAHLMEPPPSVTAKRPDLPAAIDAVIAKALAKRRDDRYETCRELVSEARHALGLKPSTAPEVAIADAGAGRTVVDRAGAEPTVTDRPAATAAGAAGPTATSGTRRPWWRSRLAIATLAVLALAGAGAGIGIGLAGGGSEGSAEAGDGGGAGGTGGTTGGTTGEGATTGEGGATTGGSETTAGNDASGGGIAFASQRDGDFDVYAMRLDGSGRVRLTNNPSNEGGPRYSPDGRRIAYWSEQDGDAEIFVMNADGSAQTQLSVNEVHDYDPAWSPDGSQLVYSSRRGGDYELVVMNADGSGERQLTENDVDDVRPSWSPDGSTIAFATSEGGDWEIATIGADGSGRTLLTDNDVSDDSPAWAPDGSLIFSSQRGEGEFNIFTMRPDGSGQRRITTTGAEDGQPRWIPDGSGIVFNSNRDGDFEIYRMDPDGSSQTQLTSDVTQDFEPDASLTAVVPPPDGSTQFLADPAAFPTEREALLLTRVPPRTRATCGRESESDRPRRAVAGVVCTSGQITVYYDLFRTKAAMNAYYNRLANGVNAARDTGSCREEGTSEGTWTVDDETRGRLLCYTATDGRAVTVWTHDVLNVVSFAVRSDDNRGRLYTWWAGPNSGPLEP